MITVTYMRLSPYLPTCLVPESPPLPSPPPFPVSFSPYPVARQFEKQRQAALLSSDTLYVYDWLELLERAVQIKWEEYAKLRPRCVAWTDTERREVHMERQATCGVSVA